MIATERLEALRRATPGWGQSVHLNHAGASLLSTGSQTAIAAHLALESQLGPMEAAEAVAPQLQEVRASAARLINASPDEVAFLSSASAAFGAVWSSLPPLKRGDRILVGRQEWGGNLASYERSAARSGAQVEVLPCRADGSVDVEAVAARLDERVRWISLTWLPANGGLINDAAALGQVAKAAGIPYFIDAGQALGQIPVDVRALGCDVLKSAGRKHLRGPRGTALLYVRRSFLRQLDPPWVDVHSGPWGQPLREDAARFETSEKPVALWLGLGAAISLALELGPAAIAARVQDLAQQLRHLLADVHGVQVRDLGDGARSGLVSFTVESRSAVDVRSKLGLLGVRVGANGVAYTPLDMQARGLDGIVRASLSYLNDKADLERLIAALRSC